MPGDPIQAIGEAASVLAEHPDPAVQAIGGWLTTWPAELISALTETENSAGHSVRVEAILARRNELLCRLGD